MSCDKGAAPGPLSQGTYTGTVLKLKQELSEFVSARALVLGGGGATGNAWLIGVVAGLFEAGLDVTEANLIVGTSAGATAAAQISSASPNELLASILAEAQESPDRPVSSVREHVPRPAENLLEITSRIIGAAENPADMRRKIGAALGVNAASDDSLQTRWRATVAARLPSHHWPERSMLITAVDADTGEPIVFDRRSGVDLVDAVAASTAGGFAYSSGDKRYIDGGYRADVNADLATAYGQVLIVAPLGDRTRKPLDWGLHLAAQVEELRARGRNVETIFPDTDSQNALGLGMTLLDPAARQGSARAGYNQGKVLAAQLIDFWR